MFLARRIVSPMQQYELVEDQSEPVDPDSATAVLKQQMLYHRDQAQEIIEKIISLLKQNNTRGDLVAMMYKYLTECNKIVIDCAAKLAPYESPKLESIEIKKTVTNKFVIQAPTAFSDQNSWLENSKKELKLLEQVKQEAQDAEIIPNGHTN